ncbi:hypothetical protein M413DRAFT_10007 [Hebeloma cylindrosporum]|uniref:Uncharacterized protein n=1 Tax=Hebeloma cylindrosporum TaxID=76867 RepID=A0A0C2Y0B7_HEBCY|nr:hypothetical protein M413DRAFT_10007 [Hebeloma cylindrosporum h7]
MSPTPALVGLEIQQHLILRLPNGTLHSVQIIKPFKFPVTKSQVFLVRPQPARRRLPRELIPKIFDPRYSDERTPPRIPRERLWTLEEKIEAARYRQEIGDG